MPDTRAAVAAAIRSINPASFGAYSAGDANFVIALYAADAVLNPSGVPSARGMAAIREDITRDVASAKASGLIQDAMPTADAGVDGQLGRQWGTYAAKERSGAAVDAGKYVYAKKDRTSFIMWDI